MNAAQREGFAKSCDTIATACIIGLGVGTFSEHPTFAMTGSDALRLFVAAVFFYWWGYNWRSL